MSKWTVTHGAASTYSQIRETFVGIFGSCDEAIEFAREYAKQVYEDDYVYVTDGHEEHVFGGQLVSEEFVTLGATRKSAYRE